MMCFMCGCVWCWVCGSVRGIQRGIRSLGFVDFDWMCSINRLMHSWFDWGVEYVRSEVTCLV